MAIPLAAVAAVPSVVKGIAGLFGIGAGKRRARRNIRPTAEVNENYLKNVALAENMGRTGLPQQQYNRAFQNIGRNQASALNTISRSANPSAGVNSLLRSSNDAVLNLDMQDANARLNNQRFAFGQRANLAQDQQRVWNWNKRDKYLEEAQAAADEIGAGRQNAFGALDNLSVLGQQYLASEEGGGSGDNFTALPNATVTQPSGYQPNFFPSPKMQPTNYNRYKGYGSFNNLRGY